VVDDPVAQRIGCVVQPPVIVIHPGRCGLTKAGRYPADKQGQADSRSPKVPHDPSLVTQLKWSDHCATTGAQPQADSGLTIWWAPVAGRAELVRSAFHANDLPSRLD